MEGFELLEAITKKREVSLRWAYRRIPHAFGDHRDFYPLASLCSSQFVGVGVSFDSKEDLENPTKFLAHFLFAKSRGEGKHVSGNFTAINRSDSDEKLKLFVTAKGITYLSEKRARARERMISLGMGMFLAVFSSLVALWISSMWKS